MNHADRIWIMLGFIGQLAFGSRFFVQWWASERLRRIVVPRIFWYLSIAGSMALLAYAWHRKDPVFLVGQFLGLFLYGRNLWIAQERPSD